MARLAAACLLAALVAPACAAAYSVRLNASRCVAQSEPQAAALGPDWAALAPYAQLCPVAGSDGRLALTVGIIRLDRAYAAHAFNKHPDQKVPSPLLRDAAGRKVGTLPEGFPVDPPGALRVTFADWRGGWPWRVDLYEAGQSAVSPHALSPLRWDAKTRLYR